jgi:hypothetical protein
LIPIALLSGYKEERRYIIIGQDEDFIFFFFLIEISKKKFLILMRNFCSFCLLKLLFTDICQKITAKKKTCLKKQLIKINNF